MAIQIPNPGTGDGATGDNEFVLWSKVKDNFSDQANAASRLVGKAVGNVMEVGAGGWLGVAPAVSPTDEITVTTCYQAPSGSMGIDGVHWGLHLQHGSGGVGYASQMEFRNGAFAFRTKEGGTWGSARTIYHTGNTTTDSNKNIKTSSPVVRVFSDHLEKIHEANELPIKYTRNDVGDYTIEGTTGLRENDWQIVIPKDDHDNQLIAFTIEDNNGTIRLKTYRRTFNMTTFMFEPDLNTSLDIPEGRWVDLHFNDLPYEMPDDTQTEV